VSSVSRSSETDPVEEKLVVVKVIVAVPVVDVVVSILPEVVDELVPVTAMICFFKLQKMDQRN